MKLSKLEQLDNQTSTIIAELPRNTYEETLRELSVLADLVNTEDRQPIDQFISQYEQEFKRKPLRKTARSLNKEHPQFKEELLTLLKKVEAFREFEALRKIKSAKENLDTELDLKDCDLESIPIEINQLTHLISLDLSDNNIKKIENLRNLKNLEKLDLGNNPIKKIENLDFLSNLKELSLNSCEIRKVENLEKTANLLTLELKDNPNLVKIEGLEHLKQLDTLMLDQCSIKVIENVDALLNLKYLSLSKNIGVERIQGLEKLKKLETLKLSECSIRKLENLEELSNLATLKLVANKIKNLEGLDNLKQLKVLKIQSCNLTSIEGLHHLEALEELDLSGNDAITKIEHLEGLENLRLLKMDHCNISKIENLHQLDNLTSISLNFNKISKLENLDELPNLAALYIEDNKIDAISLHEKTHQSYFFNFLESKPTSFFLRIGNNPFLKEIPGLNLSDYLSTYTFNPFLDEQFNTPSKVFISYSHNDIAYKKELQKYLVDLERTNKIEIWQDGMIQPGTNWDKTIRRNLETADIVILLISQDFIASNYIYDVELKRTFEQMREGNKKILPVLIKDCNFKNWKALPENILSALNEKEREDYQISNYQFLPQNSELRLQALNQWKFAEQGWVQVSQKLEELL